MYRPSRALLSIGIPLLVVFAVVQRQMHGPAPKASDAPPEQFSAVRALEYLRSTTHGTIPHPIGSPANRAIRDRIASRFDALGYETRVRRQFACNSYSVCGWTENITARPPGQPGGPTVVLAAHYDSVPAGPGASDDGTGVAALLETARAVRTEHFRNPIVFLIDDGEEAGLLGAEAFLNVPVSRFANAVINLESRGTTGPSYLFETSNNNRWFLPIVAGALPHPATSSLFYSIYQRLPNDTDLTVFKRAGMTGVNFAFIGDVEHYHTPLDDLRHVDVRTLQDQGDNALAALRALGNTELRRQSADDAVWFDVLGLFVIWWPGRWTFFFAIVSLGIAIVAAALLVRDDETTTSEIAMGFAGLLLGVIIALVAGFAISRIASIRAVQPWAPHPTAAIVAAWLAGLAASVGVLGAMRRRARSAGLLAGIAIAWNVAAIGVAVTLTGASHLFVVPAIALSLSALMRGIEYADSDTIGAAVCAAVAAVLWFPVATALYDALGTPSLPFICGALAIVATTFAAFFENSTSFAWRTAAVAALLAIIAAALPPATAAHPRRMSITYLDNGAASRWITSAMTPRVQQAAAFARTDDTIHPWAANRASLFAAPAPPLPLAPVLVTRTSDVAVGKRTLTLHVESPRGASRVNLYFRTQATVEGLRINGVVPPPATGVRRWLAPGWHIAAVRGGSSMDVEITMHGLAPVEVVATDTSFALPHEGGAIAAARDASNAVPSDEGDVTMTMRTARF